MSVWLTIPSIRPQGGTIREWKRMGYKVAVIRQGEMVPDIMDVAIGRAEYSGWARSINELVKLVIGFDKEAEWFVGGGDDTLPDPDHTPDEIAAQLTEHFGGTFGVCQPTGDYKLWPNSNILGMAGSPWMGRSFCELAYGGRGPLYEDYRHNWSDQELMEVAVKLGCFWQRPDLIHQHNHAGRTGAGWRWEPFQVPLQDPDLWVREKAHFEERRAQGFPGCEPLVMVNTCG